MATAIEDEKTSAESSTVLDDKAASSAVQQAEKDVKEPSTMQEAIEQAFEKHPDVVEESSATEKKEAEESDVQKLNNTEEKEESGEQKETPEGDVEDEDDAAEEDKAKDEVVKGPVPYERFDEVVKQKNDFEAKWKSVEPLARQQSSIVEFCERNMITPQQFQDVLEIQALLNTDPAKAWERLKPVVEQLQGLNGDKLPADLQQEVDDGGLTLQRAKEIADLRAKAKFGEQKHRFSVEQQQNAQRNAFVASVQQSMSTWVQQKQLTNPAFKAKANDADPDGFYELVYDKLTSLIQQNGLPRTAQDAVANAEKAYLAVEASLRGFQPKPKLTRRAPLSTTSSGNGKKEPTSMEEAVRLAAAKHGL